MNIFFFSFIIGSVDFDENTLPSDYIYIILMINCHLKCVSFTYTTHIVAQLWILMFASTLVCNACYIYFFLLFLCNSQNLKFYLKMLFNF